MKRPAFQFYPADWRKDAALQSCSLAAQGLWVNMLCIAHECEPYGHLTINGRAMTEAQIARLVGVSLRECERAIAELVLAGVVSRTDETADCGEGVFYSRRMVRDEDVRNRRAEGGKAGSEHGVKGAAHGAKGGRPAKVRGVSKPPIEPPPSSSSSSSSSEEIPPTPKGEDAPGFARFWAAWPVGDRKGGRAKCLEVWKRARLEPDSERIIAHVEAMKATAKWREDGGAFVPMPSTYLNGRRWDGAELDLTGNHVDLMAGAV